MTDPPEAVSWRSKVWRIIWILGAGYGLVCLLLYTLQRKLIYPAPVPVAVPSVPGCIQLRVEQPDGCDLVGLYAEASKPGAPTLVYFHGNAEQVAWLDDVALAFRAEGLGFLALEYPGYGALHEHAASEASIYASAEAAVAWLQERGTPVDSIVAVGRSLGSGPATELAFRGRVGRLILISPFTSLTAMGQRAMPFLPARLLMRDRFDNRRKAAEIEVAVLVAHGTRDAIIPVAMGRELADCFPDARFLALEGRGHNDLDLGPGSALVRSLAGFALGGD